MTQICIGRPKNKDIHAEFIYPDFQKVALAHSAAAQLHCTEAAEWASATF